MSWSLIFLRHNIVRMAVGLEETTYVLQLKCRLLFYYYGRIFVSSLRLRATSYELHRGKKQDQNRTRRIYLVSELLNRTGIEI